MRPRRGVLIRLAAVLVVGVGVWRMWPAANAFQPTGKPSGYIYCPSSLSATFGGSAGWSSMNVGANVVRAVIKPGKPQLLYCQYGFGKDPQPGFGFGISRPCPKDSFCVVDKSTFPPRFLVYKQ